MRRCILDRQQNRARAAAIERLCTFACERALWCQKAWINSIESSRMLSAQLGNRFHRWHGNGMKRTEAVPQKNFARQCI
jgi:hypothetical protein